MKPRRQHPCKSPHLSLEMKNSAKPESNQNNCLGKYPHSRLRPDLLNGKWEKIFRSNFLWFGAELTLQVLSSDRPSW